jgi:hypothetical protein
MTTTAVPLDSLAQRIARQQSEIETLQRQYQARQARLADLKRRKEELEGQLRKLDAEIQAVNQGKTPPLQPGATKASPAKAPTAAPLTNAPRPNTLPGLLVQLVRKAKGPLTVRQLADEVEKQKFPTSSKNVARLVGTRVRGLMARGIFLRANGQPGFILARAKGEVKAPIAKPPVEKTGAKKGAVLSIKARREEPNGRPKKPLRVILTDLLAKSRKPLLVRELAERAKAQGYQTESKNFVHVIWVALGDMDHVENIPGKGYRLKKR